jgi:tetratricopeptide (TPR) repeat protein
MPNRLDRFQFDTFISYNESNAKGFVEIIQKILFSHGIESFVAHIQRKTYSEIFDDVRETVINSCKYFIFVNTEGALDREQIIKEFKLAYPDGLKEKPHPIVFRYHESDVEYSTRKFEDRTGIDLRQINQIPFKDERELVQIVIDFFNDQFNLVFLSKLKKTKPRIFDDERTIFYGREQELNELSQLLSSEQHIISLVGEGGIGKSALAFKAIHQVENGYVYTIKIPIDPKMTFSTFLTVMGRGLLIEDELAKAGDEGTRGQIIRNVLLRANNGILFLDNFESISDYYDRKTVPHNIRQINNFLEGVPENVKIILTSRNKNNLFGEVNFDVKGLLTVDGRKLFLEISKNYSKNSPSEFITALDEILESIESHPIGIRLLAGSYRGQGIKELNDIKRHLTMDIRNVREADKKHVSLNSCFTYSYRRLPNKLKNILQLLTIFNSPFSASAATSIINEKGSAFVRLYDRTWLRRNEPYVIESRQGLEWIYEFHPLIKQYVNEKMKGKEALRNQYLLRLFKYYTQFITAVSWNEYTNLLEGSLIIDSIILKTDNDLERSINAILNEKDRSTCSNDLGIILYRMGYPSQGLEYHFKCLQIDNGQKDYKRILNDYINIGYYYFSIRDYTHALQYYLDAMETTDNHFKDSKDLICHDHIRLAMVLVKLGLLRRAWDHLVHALKTKKQFEDIILSVILYGNLGVYYTASGSYSVALICFQYAKRLDEKLGRRAMIATDLRNIGSALKHLGNVEKAIESYKEALAITTELNLLVGSKIACDQIIELLTIKKDIAEIQSFTKLSEKLEEERIKRKMPEKYHDYYV